MKKLISILIVLTFLFALAASGSNASDTVDRFSSSAETTPSDAAETVVSYRIGSCNYVDDASLIQIVDNIHSQLSAIGAEHGVNFETLYDSCSANRAHRNHRGFPKSLIEKGKRRYESGSKTSRC